tara:strand:+ start:54 stop:185 length:132 start_codon:yes stop_codon:yes gene_type:complete
MGKYSIFVSAFANAFRNTLISIGEANLQNVLELLYIHIVLGKI